ncbi:MAG TPA: hypothetical protein VF541_08080 [Longimicrobium sp.]
MSRRRPDAQLPWEQPRADADARRIRRRRRAGWVAYAVILVAALASVVWRQTLGVERFRELQHLHDEVQTARAERDEAASRLLQLQRRERIVAYAQQRLGMHVARDEEIVLLRVPASAAPRADSAAEARP